MFRKICMLAVCLMLLVGMPISVSAASDLPMVVDNANLFTASEKQALEEKAQSLRSEYELDVVILTVPGLNGYSAQNYADDYFDQNGYGYGDSGNGILFLLAMNEREWYISTCGDAIYIFTDYSIQQLGETAVWYLSDGYYYEGFDDYLDALPSYLRSFQQGNPVGGYADDSVDFYHGTQEDMKYYRQKTGPNYFLSLVIGMVSAAVVIFIMRGSMNTRRQQNGACSYIKPGSFHLRSHQDLFLYSNVSKVRRQQNQNNSHRGSGSSVHHSSRGRSHGGGGGRF